jgi:hypothetical protein
MKQQVRFHHLWHQLWAAAHIVLGSVLGAYKLLLGIRPLLSQRRIKQLCRGFFG